MKPGDSYREPPTTTKYQAVVVDGLNIAYREAGSAENPNLRKHPTLLGRQGDSGCSDVASKGGIISQPGSDRTTSMKLVSVNCGMPREVTWHGRTVTTAIYKEPIVGRVALRKLNLDGDRQADLSVHGGAYKAVYCYPSEHYDYWRSELPDRELPICVFGENFTIEGLVDDSVHIGDRLLIGSAEVVVTQPRLPCFKLGIRFEADDMVKRFLLSRRMGFYLAVLREGEVGAGDKITITSRDPDSLPVPWITRLYVAKNYTGEEIAAVKQLLTLAALPDSWKAYFSERLEGTNG
jgi:MOSC domain-containing protein YiiM